MVETVSLNYKKKEAKLPYHEFDIFFYLNDKIGEKMLKSLETGAHKTASLDDNIAGAKEYFKFI